MEVSLPAGGTATDEVVLSITDLAAIDVPARLHCSALESLSAIKAHLAGHWPKLILTPRCSQPPTSGSSVPPGHPVPPHLLSVLTGQRCRLCAERISALKM
jgi:hypothetical protein